MTKLIVFSNSLIIILMLMCIFFKHSNGDSEYDADNYHPYKPNRDKITLGQYPEEVELEYWNTIAQNMVSKKINEKLNEHKAKNVILFLGDGMSLATVAAARNLKGKENHFLSFEKFQHFGLSKTYCVDKQVADSACTATAYLSGVKGNYGTIGVNAQVPRFDCEEGLDNSKHTESIASWAQAACKATGIVTTTRVTHASPAGVYAHTANRNWENDAEVEMHCISKLVDDIAEQLVYGDVGKNLKVILGGGRGDFINNDVEDEEKQFGRRFDNKDLIEEWKEEHKELGNTSYIWNNRQLKSLDIENTEYLLGLFENDHCQYTADIEKYHLEDKEPTLSEMVHVAIKILSKQQNGFFLFVEGGRIDLAHHETKARKALTETIEFSNAIEVAKQLTSEEDTLIVVTSDHSHTMTFSGYPVRGSDVLGISEISNSDKLPLLTLSYANGPGFKNLYNEKDKTRVDYSKIDISSLDFQYPNTVELIDETHGGDDVGIYASGPGSHMFVGNYEQNNIPILMSFLSKIGPYNDDPERKCENAGNSYYISSSILLSCVIFYRFFDMLHYI